LSCHRPTRCRCTASLTTFYVLDAHNCWFTNENKSVNSVFLVVAGAVVFLFFLIFLSQSTPFCLFSIEYFGLYCFCFHTQKALIKSNALSISSRGWFWTVPSNCSHSNEITNPFPRYSNQQNLIFFFFFSFF
jgi:hypothetical protein